MACGVEHPASGGFSGRSWYQVIRQVLQAPEAA